MFLEFVEEQIILFVALGIIAVMLASSYFSDKLAGYNSVSAEEAVRLYNNDAKVFDARTSEEFKSGYIGQAENLTGDKVLQRLEQLSFAKEDAILMYCQSGARSATVARSLVKAGYTNVSNLSGGIMAWQNAGLPVNKPVSKKKQKKQDKKEQQGKS
jgi:rhodanese-related sulfurtransferase